MASSRAARLQVGSAPWIAEERSSAQQITHDEIEEFGFSARNDFEWLNEHMADIFSENQINVADIFKTPGKLRGKTPRTARKQITDAVRVPLSNIFSATPKGAPNPFALPNADRAQQAKVKIATDSVLQPSLMMREFKPPSPQKNTAAVSLIDSGYHGSQDLMEVDQVNQDIEEPTQVASPRWRGKAEHVAFQVASPMREIQETPARPSRDPTTTIDNAGELDTQYFTAHAATIVSPTTNLSHNNSTTPVGSPVRAAYHASPKKTSPIKSPLAQSTFPPDDQPDTVDPGLDEPSRSPSEGSSPIRPIVRKSSLNFASLPAREPMTHKTAGHRISRTSHLDQRTSYYNRHTGGKSLGHVRHEESSDDNDEMDVDEEDTISSKKPKEQVDEAAIATAHNKTYTQRLQDQISKLGQSQATTSRPTKSIANVIAAAPQQIPAAAVAPAPQSLGKTKVVSSPKTHTTPGAFPEDDDDDDWIQPLGPPDNASNLFSPRPVMPKSHSADVMEGLAGKDTVSGGDFSIAKTREQKNAHLKSPERPKLKGAFGHHKSASVPSFPHASQVENDEEGAPLKKTISVSNPSLATVAETEGSVFDSPPKSPSRTLRESPLKQVKNKLSSILKSSKGLLASSAAISAEGKSQLISPSTVRLGLLAGPSTASLDKTFTADSQPLYPDLSRQAADNQTLASTASAPRRTRASIEREKAEEKRREKEAKEARVLAEQMEKLEKAREKEREKARVFSKEQERVAAMEKQLAAHKEDEKRAPTTTPAPKQALKPTRTSPRKVKEQAEADEQTGAAQECDVDEDLDMAEVTTSMPPPSVQRSAIPSSAAKGREIKRPTKPVKESTAKAKQAPTVIRVNMGSQHPQYHPSNIALASNLHDTLGPAGSQSQSKLKSSQAPAGSKTPLPSLKSSQSGSRPKALEMAARRKEQEEKEAQRKRDAKAELEKKRVAAQEEERRQEQQRKQDAEKQREAERKQASVREEAKKNAQRQAALEKAKQTRAPPPAVRTANGQPDYAQAGRPPSRIGSTVQRSQEDLGRSTNTGLNKSTTKRTLQPELKDSKRMRMTDDFDNDVDMENQPSLKGAPVRPSGGFKKVSAATLLPQGQKIGKPQELANKSIFPAGYTNAPPSATRDLFKTTLTNQHNAQTKAAHPLDMAQVSKSAIPFAPNPNPAGPSHKTPARPVGTSAAKSNAKSATRSSPRFQNGEQIELPEINTDDEDEYSDDEHKQMFASWTDSPALRRALVEQEAMDPMQVFGAPAPLNMEEVFSKSKDRWHKFRQRTSSANWSGADRLTEDDIRKDLAARDKLRKEGAWSYEMSKDML